MAKFEKVKKVKKDWGRVRVGQYQAYFWALPILPFYHFWKKFKEWKYDRLVWDEERATKVLNKILAKKLDWDEEDEAFYYCMGWGRNNFDRYVPFWHKKWTRKFSTKLHYFVQDGYQNADYVKTVIKPDNSWDETWVKFSEK